MHGIRRTKIDAATLAAKREKEKEKLAAYLELEKQILDLRDAKEWTQAALQLTEQLLTTNPEQYTIWNYRRDIFTNKIFLEKSPEDVHKLLFSDLAMTTTALKKYPKVYWIWNHRRWCLENMPDGPGSADDTGKNGKDGYRISAWTQEMLIVEKMLSMDERNFHAWDYRRYILSHCPPSLKRTDADELAYTTRHIEKNHSNFSAWHQRSLVYTKLWSENPSSRRGVLDQEFELVKQALWMAPDDQSGWMYHRWLIGNGEDPEVLVREIGNIEELLQEEPDSRWCLNSLVHYKSLLLRHQPENKATLKQECQQMLEKLREIDPKRKQRYIDIEAAL
ncbi:protein prenylyltransferase [Serendipita vermifera]|nr:protein prenylyltransferase [Serendipita vermifera]